MPISRRLLLASLPAFAAAQKLEPPPPAKPEPEEPPVEIPAIAPLAPGAAGGRFAGRRFAVQRLVDAEDTAALVNDIVFMSAQRGIAVGGLAVREREEPHALVTRDGGANWTAVKLKDFPLALAMIDESRGFFVGRSDLWYTNEGGLVWQKRKLPKGNSNKPMLGARFLDEKRGWVYGAGKTFYSTEDGGLNWKPVAESAALKLKDENTSWSWIELVGPQLALAVGSSASPPREVSRFPDWMMPERAARRRLTPSTTMMAETHDAGKSWRTGVASTFGRVMRLRTLGVRGVAVYHYGDGMEVPSEVYSLNLTTGRSSPLFRRRDLWVHDAVPLEGGGVMLAAIEPPGKLRATPIPGRLRIFVSTNESAGGDNVWSEIKVDYRAAGRRAMLASAAGGHFWAATNEGTILKLV